MFSFVSYMSTVEFWICNLRKKMTIYCHLGIIGEKKARRMSLFGKISISLVTVLIILPIMFIFQGRSAKNKLKYVVKG